MIRTIIAGASVAFAAIPASAQQFVSVCEEQQQLEQVIGSEGGITPEGCRQATISVLESRGERLCLLDFSGAADGVLAEIQQAATQQKWWVRCQDVEAVVAR